MARGGSSKDEFAALHALIQNARAVQKQIGTLVAQAQKQTDALGVVITAAERALASGRSVVKRASEAVAGRTGRAMPKRRTAKKASSRSPRAGAPRRKTATRSTGRSTSRSRKSTGGSSGA